VVPFDHRPLFGLIRTAILLTLNLIRRRPPPPRFIVKVFLSWSGERSKAVAEALKSWLPQVIQSLEPWISSEIDKGRKWSTELATELETVPVGIICLTRDNLSKPWILFEAGALSKNVNTWTFLFDVTGANVEQPLAQFQHTENEKEDIRKLVHSIAGAARNAGEKVPEASVLNDIFETFWPKLEEKFKSVAPIRGNAAPAASMRTDRQILEEILEVVRVGQRRDDRPVEALVRPNEPQVSAAILWIHAASEDDRTDFERILLDNEMVAEVKPLLGDERTYVRFTRRLPYPTAIEMIRAVEQISRVIVVRVTQG